ATSAVQAVAMDAQNNVYATGYTQAHDFPTTVGTFSPGCTGADATRYCGDAFVMKIDSAGGLVWETNYGYGFVGCPALGGGTAIAVDSQGAVYVAGTTPGCGPPQMNPFQSVANG